MNVKANRACAWGGAAFVLLFLVGFWFVAGFVPPPRPSSDAATIAHRFVSDAAQIRVGMIISSLSAILIVPWAASIYTQLRRIEGRNGVWALVQFAGALMSTLVFEYILFFWIAATFRSGRSPEIIQAINDLAWLPFVGIVGTAVLQAVAIGIAILSDKREQPVLPRWVGYFNFWAALLFMPGTVASFFKHGPLAWNGILSWYMVLTVFCAWFVVNTLAVLRAIAQQERDGPEPADDLGLLRADVASMRAELDLQRAGT